MKKLYLVVISLFFACRLIAQPYNNEWISFAGGNQSTQQYYRINIWKEGIYRINYSDITASGLTPTGWLFPANLQLFHNGQEQFIEVKDDGNGILNPGDYFEFYGKPTDGTLDSRLYDSTHFQPNPFYSMFNDTAAYYLTYNFSAASTHGMPVVVDTISFTGYTPQSFYIKEELAQYVTDYNDGERDASGIADNSYTAGEGFLGSIYSCNRTTPLNQSFQTSNMYNGTADIEVVVAGGNNDNHPILIKVNGTTYITDIFYSYEMRKYNFTATGLSNGMVTVTIEPQDAVGIYMNYIHPSYIKISYPRTFSFTGMNAPLKINAASGATKSYIELNGLNTANPLLYIVEEDSVKRIVLSKGGGLLKALVPVYGTTRKCYVTDASLIMTLPGNATITPVGNNTGYFTNYDYVATNKSFLIITNKKLWNSASAYAAYRDSSGFPSLLADVEELYDQFSWGITKHPIAIRNYTDYLLDNVTPKPQYLFLFGKSVISKYSRNTNYALNLLPTYGEPAGDAMFTSRLNSSEFIPELATGRLAAQNDTDGFNYLDKIKMYEAMQKQPPQEWMKQILHFGGGQNSDEQNLLAAKLGTYRSIIEDTLFGGSVITFLKNSTDPIQVNQTQYLQSLIDDGCSMMTFYGHAAGSSFDIATDAPENYTNYGKYPFVLAQSCLVGDIHSTSKLLNERFVLAKDKAAIGFLAVPDKAYIDQLDVYSLELHKELFTYAYGTTIGKSMQRTVDSIITPSFDIKSVCMNMTLHGDPALMMNFYPKTELKVSNADVFFNPASVATSTENFEVKVVITNLAKTTSAAFELKLTRIFPDGNAADTTLIISATHYRDTVTIQLPVDFQRGAGLNVFNVIIDESNVIDEYDNTTNNIASAQLIINSTDINPVYPQQYAIVPNSTISLKATTANLFASPRNYLFQVDTNDHFTSPLHSGIAANASGIVSYTIPFSLDSNRVYYWRVANDSISSADTSVSNEFQWKTSSFIYKPGITGWSQAHFHQFRYDEFTNIIYNDTLTKQFEFVTDSNTVLVQNYYTPILGNAEGSVFLNNSLIESGRCGLAGNTFALCIFDSVDNRYAWNTLDQDIGNFNKYNPANGGTGTCRNRVERFFLFPYNTQAYVDSLVAAIVDSIPDGNYFALWTVKNFESAHFDYTTMHAPLFATLSAMGGPTINLVQDNDIFIFFTQKGHPNLTQVVIGDSVNHDISLTATLGGRWNKGYVTSTVVGPSLQWDQLHWNHFSTEPGPTQDSIALSVIGIKATGEETVLMNNIGPSMADIYNLNSTVDASIYPYLRLKAYKEDLGITPTPPQLDKWQVYYQPVPEGALNTKFYTLDDDTIEEGDNLFFRMAFENISTIGMDTLLVDYYIYDKNNIKHNLGSQRLHRTLPAGDTIMSSVSFNTLGYSGDNTLWIEANPNNDQPEQYHFNNITSLPFRVSKDITNPLLDVTFDGVHILNGDIISAKPGIQIQLNDENKFIALNDTANFRVRIKSPKGTESYIYFEKNSGVSSDKSLLKWTPASLPKNSFRIEYNPEFSEDGIYELIVQASDESANLSGSKDYRITFEVINRSTITNVINYPNPFSTATRFVFVLTGSEVPQDFLIQIMTVSGKMVRHITKQELGNLHIGRNITDYAWDGRDDFGDQLANGVYLYRVLTRLNGEEIENRETSADQYFTKGWGKMYLMR